MPVNHFKNPPPHSAQNKSLTTSPERAVEGSIPSPNPTAERTTSSGRRPSHARPFWNVALVTIRPPYAPLSLSLIRYNNRR